MDDDQDGNNIKMVLVINFNSKLNSLELWNVASTRDM
jgi:hypothetical protein